MFQLTVGSNTEYQHDARYVKYLFEEKNTNCLL